MNVYLISSGRYSSYSIVGVLIPPDGAPTIEVRWEEFRARFALPKKEDYAKKGQGYFSSSFYDDVKAAEKRVEDDLRTGYEDLGSGFYAWLIRDCGCVEPEDVQERNVGY